MALGTSFVGWLAYILNAGVFPGSSRLLAVLPSVASNKLYDMLLRALYGFTCTPERNSQLSYKKFLMMARWVVWRYKYISKGFLNALNPSAVGMCLERDQCGSLG